MGDVINFPQKNVVKSNFTTYLQECKYALETEDYESVLMGFVDIDYYNDLEEDLQDIVLNLYALCGIESKLF